jgi:hypothetical protein
MISIDKKFIFVAVMKTGTMSITSALSKYSLDRDGHHYTARELKNGHLTSHSSIRLGSKNNFINLYKKHWNDYYTFGFVRNPWDHFVSLYKWCKKHGNQKTKYGFDAFLTNQFNNNYDCLFDWEFTCQSDRLFDNGVQIVDFVGRYENIEEDFQKICNQLSINESLPKINISVDKRGYRNFYKNDNQIEMIREMYIKDVERFKYEF